MLEAGRGPLDAGPVDGAIDGSAHQGEDARVAMDGGAPSCAAAECVGADRAIRSFETACASLSASPTIC